MLDLGLFALPSLSFPVIPNTERPSIEFGVSLTMWAGPPAPSRSTRRAFLLLSGSIHYPRFAEDEWAHQMNLTRQAGLNTVQTYVSEGHDTLKHSRYLVLALAFA